MHIHTFLLPFEFIPKAFLNKGQIFAHNLIALERQAFFADFWATPTTRFTGFLSLGKKNLEFKKKILEFGRKN